MTNQCQHGQLARVCELCDKDAEIAQLREYLDTAQRRASALGDEVAGLLEVVESAAAADEYYDHPPAIQRLATMARIALAARKEEA